MNFTGNNWRGRRNNILNNQISFVPMQFTIANYSTEVRKDKKTELESFDQELLTKISNIPDPLKKNLADTVCTSQGNKETRKMPQEVLDFHFNHSPEDKNESSDNRSDFYPTITGITSFFTNFFGAISGAVFHRRPKSPVSQYYDCYDSDSDLAHQMAPNSWLPAKTGDQNKKRAPESPSAVANDNMNNCRAAAAHCEDKINAVKTLLTTKAVPTTPKLRPRRPKREFVQPKSIEDSYEEDFASDEYTSLANEEYIEYFVKPNNQNQILNEIDAAKMKTEFKPVPDTTEIVAVVPEAEKEPVILKQSNDVKREVISSKRLDDVKREVISSKQPDDVKREVISSCEDKMAKLKLLLQGKCQKSKLNDSTDSMTEPDKEERKQKPSKVVPIEKKQDKKFKNPNRLVEKRNKSKMRKSIQDDMFFANEIDLDETGTPDTPPHMQMVAENVEIGSMESLDYFNELKGRFHSTSTTDSEDSFQIVFSDSPRPSRVYHPSECDSEDSFIIFEDSPDSCYTSNDVFNDSEDDSDTESDVSDSGCALDLCKLSHGFSRTVSDLTDDSLYEDSVAKPVDDNNSNVDASNSKNDDVDDINSEIKVSGDDELDCAVRTFEEMPSEDICAIRPGLLINEARKQLRKNLPAKKVTFADKPPTVRVMRVWAYAARQARAGHWERHALDRERFKRRIADVDMALSWVLKPQHRSRVMFQRFMPWWNQQKRKEAAERKVKAEEERRLAEERKEIEEEEMRRAEEVRGVVEVEADEEDDAVLKEGVEKDEIADGGKNEEIGLKEEVKKYEILDMGKNVAIALKKAVKKNEIAEVGKKEGVKNNKIVDMSKNGKNIFKMEVKNNKIAEVSKNEGVGLKKEVKNEIVGAVNTSTDNIGLNIKEMEINNEIVVDTVKNGKEKNRNRENGLKSLKIGKELPKMESQK